MLALVVGAIVWVSIGLLVPRMDPLYPPRASAASERRTRSGTTVLEAYASSGAWREEDAPYDVRVVWTAGAGGATEAYAADACGCEDKGEGGFVYGREAEFVAEAGAACACARGIG